MTPGSLMPYYPHMPSPSPDSPSANGLSRPKRDRRTKLLYLLRLRRAAKALAPMRMPDAPTEWPPWYRLSGSPLLRTERDAWLWGYAIGKTGRPPVEAASPFPPKPSEPEIVSTFRFLKKLLTDRPPQPSSSQPSSPQAPSDKEP